MKLLLSVPSGFHARELLTPLKRLLESDADIASVHCLTPAAPFSKQLFPEYGGKFVFHKSPAGGVERRELMKKVGPDVVITNTAGLDSADVPILRAARQLSLPTVTFIASWDNVWKMERLKNESRPQVLADYLLVWNQMMRDHLLRVFPELNQERISVAGAPRFDYFTHEDSIPSRRDLLGYLNLPNDGSKLLHFATTELYPMEYVVRDIFSAAQKGRIKHKLSLYASVHPGGDIKKHRPYADKYGVTVRYAFGRLKSSPHPDFHYHPSEKDIYLLVALFKHSDLLINHSSTVAIESFFGHTPVINVKYGRPFDWWRWYRSMVYRDFKEHYRDIISGGATKIVRHPRQLIAAINDYLDSPSRDSQARQKTLRRLVTTTDGSAGQKVLKCIKTAAGPHRL